MDIYAAVTDRIIAQLEAGQIPWHKPWVASGQAISRSTGKPYSLLNQLLLGQPGEYVTFKQAQQEGGHFKKGERASMVVFGSGWKKRTKRRTKRSRFPSSAITASFIFPNVKD